MIEAVKELRQQFIDLMSNPFVGVQQMVGPTGTVFKLKFYNALKPRKILKRLK